MALPTLDAFRTFLAQGYLERETVEPGKFTIRRVFDPEQAGSSDLPTQAGYISNSPAVDPLQPSTDLNSPSVSAGWKRPH